MEVNNLATEDSVDQLLPNVADGKIEGRGFGWSIRPILAGLGVFAIAAVVINSRQAVDLGTMDVDGLQELREWLPWKEGEGRKKEFFLNADNRAGSSWGDKNKQVCIDVPKWGCPDASYDSFACAMPSLSSWSSSSDGHVKDRTAQCNSNANCAGYAGWDDGYAWRKVWTMKLGKTRLTEHKSWKTCLKKRIKCGNGYAEYRQSQPSWCHATYSPMALTSGEASIKSKCDADPGCTGYTHMTDQDKVYLLNNHATRTVRGMALAYNKWWKCCMKIEGMQQDWHNWCW